MGVPASKLDLKPTQRRLLVPISTLLFLLVGGAASILYWEIDINSSLTNEDLLSSMLLEITEGLQEQADLLQKLGGNLSSQDRIGDLLVNGRRDMMLAEYSPQFDSFRDLFGITHFYLHGPDGSNLIRFHQPQRFGDTITRFTLLEASRTRQVSSGLELGPLGTLTLRVVTPVFGSDQLVGFTELGIEIGNFLGDIGRRHANDLVMMIDKNKLNRGNWESGMQMLGETPDWDHYEDVVIVHSSYSEIPAELDTFFGATIDSVDGQYEEIKFDEKTWTVLHAHITDVNGAKTGHLTLVKDITESKAALYGLFGYFYGGAAVLLAVLLGFIYTALKRVDTSITNQQRIIAESEYRLKEAQHIGQIGSWELDRASGRLILSEEVFNIFGLQGNDSANSFETYLDFIHREDFPDVERAYVEAIRSHRSCDVVFRLRLVADDEKIVHVRFKPIYDEEGSCTRIAGTIQDVTEQKEQEKSLKEYSQRLQTLHTIDRAILSASTLEAIAQVGVEQLRAIVPSYRAAVRMLNEDRTALEAIATDADEETWITAGHLTPVSDVLEVDIFKKVLAGEDMIIVGFDKPGPHPPLLQALIDEGIQSGFSIPLMAKENVIGTISLTSKDANAFSKHHMEIAKEISNSLSVAIQQAMLLEELMASKKQVVQMSRRLVAIQEEERRHLAQELHDEVGGLLSSLQISLSTPSIEENGQESQNRLASDILDSLMEQISSVSLRLRPSILDDVGLFAALQWFIELFQKQTHLHVEFETNLTDETSFSTELEITAYRIVQESLTNVSRHAGVERAHVQVFKKDGCLFVRVSDEGDGFVVDAIGSGATMGIAGMKERAMLVGGTLTCESAKGRGTEIQAQLPLN